MNVKKATNNCTVRLVRDPKIEALAKLAKNQSRVSKRRQSMFQAKNEAAPKSILKKTSSVCGRSKSISFEATVQHSAGAKVVRSKQHVDKKNSLQQNTAISGPSTSAKNNSLVGISVQQNSDVGNGTVQQIAVTEGTSSNANNLSSGRILAQQNSGGPNENGVGEQPNIDGDDEYLARPNQATLAFADIMVFENRIAGLTQANTAKINRIQALSAERNGLLAQVESLNRINRSLAETVDLYKVIDNQNRDLPNELAKAKAANSALHKRVAQSNKENFELKQENKRMKSILATYSKNVLEEHNYHLN